MIRQHPADYAQKGDNRIHAVRLREPNHVRGANNSVGVAGGFDPGIHHCVLQRCNLILARSVRREGELSFGRIGRKQGSAASHAWLAESLLLCGRARFLGS